MKKLTNISNQIKSNTYSYTGKGAFEAVVNSFKDEIITWLEELVPLQQQIEYLKIKSNLEFQKRNYTRILTKILPEQYTEFVSVNILVRDANVIASYYHKEFNLTLLYDILLKNNYLKYPGKYKKYVEFNIFQKFIMMYRNDLLESLENNNKEEVQEQEIVVSKSTKENTEIETKEPIEEKIPPKTDTNWLNLLVGR